MSAEDFWAYRPELQYIHDYARAIRVAPWALLSCALARVSAATPSNIVIPPLVGDRPASLNFDVAVVGNPGTGKGLAESAANTLIPDIRNATVTQPASGEGLAAIFSTRISVDDEDSQGDTRTQCVTSRALLSIAEIGTLAGASKRIGSTVTPTLCSAWSGEPLGAFNKNEANRLTVPAHAYRLSMIVGVQPAASATVFDAVNVGLPQRFLWTSTLDRDAPSKVGAIPSGRFPFTTDMLPADPSLTTYNAIYETGTIRGALNYSLNRMSFPQVAFIEADTERLAVLRGQTLHPLDSHRIQLKAKVAALLALLDSGRLNVSEEDWALADMVIQQSCAIRDDCIKAMHEAKQNQKADWIADDDEAREKAQARKLESVKTSIFHQLDRHDPQHEGVKGYAISRMLGRNGRYAYDAIEELYRIGRLDRLQEGDGTAASLWAMPC